MLPLTSRPSLTRQLVVPVALLSVGVVVAVVGLSWWQMTRQLERQLFERARTVSRNVSSSAESNPSREEMNRLSRTLVAGGDVEFAAVFGLEPRRMILTSRPAWQGRRVEELPVAEFDARVVAALQARTEFAALDRRAARYYFVGPVGGKGPAPLRDAQLLLVLNTGPLQEQIVASLRGLLAGLAAIGALGLAGLAWLVRVRVIRPLTELAEAFRPADPAGGPWAAGPGAAREIATLGEALGAAFGQVRELNRGLEQRVRDRTAELVALLDREREAGRLRTNFIGMVSHEYRNSLATILSSTQMLERYRERLSEAERERHLAQITASCHRLASLVEDVLLYSRSENGRIEVNLAPLDLVALGRAEAAEAARQADGGTGRVVFADETSEPEGGMAVSDEQLLHHVLSNLLGNAVKYSPADRTVEFRLRRAGGDAVFTVRDRGIGIPAGELPHVGEAFRRGRNVADRPGTGLGLVMVRRCLELLGGTLRLESVEGEGTTATVMLPAFGPAEEGRRP